MQKNEERLYDINEGTETEDMNNETKGAKKTDDVEDVSEAMDDLTNEAGSDELKVMKLQLDDKSRQCEEYFCMLQRAAAEFDNFKKRTAREKEALYSEAVSDVVSAFLPVIDSIERAIQVCSGQEAEQSIKEGIELVNRQIKEVLKKLGVEEISSMGEEFNPQLHNAVMHVEDESYGHNIVVEEFQRGYIYKDRVIRHSMVKVAN